MPDLPQTRQSLLVRLKDRSDDAWSEFLAIYEKSIIDFARKKGLQEADAKDVTQQVLTAVESKLQSWNADPARGKFRGWLFRVARNIAVDTIMLRAKSPQTGGTQISDKLNRVTDRSQESGEFLMNYRQQLLHWAAQQVRPRVSERSWNAFWMTAMEGREPAEVAQQLGTTKGNVYAAKFRVVTRIQEQVARFDHGDQPDFEVGGKEAELD